METFKKILFYIIDWTWCLPQTLLGFIIYIFVWKKDSIVPGKISDNKAKVLEEYEQKTYTNIVIRTNYDHKNGVWGNDRAYDYISGCSLGRYILMKPYHDFATICHEYGHVRQSRMLGPLYLFVVGIPSAINNLKSRKGKLNHITYYQQYPENWADKLGGVQRQ